MTGDTPRPRSTAAKPTSGAQAPGIVAFRTHLWDDSIAAVARRLFERRGGWDFVVLADETRAKLNTAPYAKVSHTEDFADLGLPRSGDPRELWFNSDYSFYRLLEVEPRYEYFCISEYDVLVHDDLAAVFAATVAETLDLVTHRLGIAPPDWGWIESARDVYPTVYWSLNPFIVLSRRALEYLLERRQELAQQWREGRFSHWPYFEAFVGAELYGSGKFRTAPLSRFGRLDYFDWWPPHREATAQALSNQMLVHPVHDDARFARAWLRDEPKPDRYFRGDSPLRQRLAGVPWAVLFSELRAAMIERKRHLGLMKLYAAVLLRWRDR